MNWKQLIELEGYINLWEVIPEDKHSKLANLIWEALDDEGITLTPVSYTHLTLPTILRV